MPDVDTASTVGVAELEVDVDERVVDEEEELVTAEADGRTLDDEPVADPRSGMLSCPILNGLPELVGLAAAGPEALGETTVLEPVVVDDPSPLPTGELAGALGSAPAPTTGTSGAVMPLIKSELVARFLSIRAWVTKLLASTKEGRMIVHRVTRSANV